MDNIADRVLVTETTRGGFYLHPQPGERLSRADMAELAGLGFGLDPAGSKALYSHAGSRPALVAAGLVSE